MNYSKFLYVVAFATVLFTACGNDSSTSANNSNDGDNSSKSSSSQKTVSSSSREVIEFVNPADVVVGSMKDSRDGQKYKTVKIGKQTWMAQNLNYKMANSYCYNDTSSYCDKYGRLYAWAAAKSACPTGWHLPSQTEWQTLLTVADGAEARVTAGKKSRAGVRLKSKSGWNGTDDFSFSALPAGYRDDDGISRGGGCDDEDCNEGGYAQFWSSTEGDDSDYVYIMSLNDFDGVNYCLNVSDCLYGGAYLEPDLNWYAYSVRCLKD